MKKLLLFISALFILSLGYSQKYVSILQVADSLQTFKVTSVPANTLIFDKTENRIWKLTAKETGADNLSTSAKVLVNSFSNIYTIDDTLTGNRIVEGDGVDLTFNGIGTEQHNVASFNVVGTSAFSLSSSGAGAVALGNSGAGDVTLSSSAGNVRIHALAYPKLDGAINYVLKTDGSTNLGFADVSTLFTDTSIYSQDATVLTSRIATLTDTLSFNRASHNLVIGGTMDHVDIEVPQGSTNPLGLYESRVEGANIGDLYSIDFYFNDNTGARTIADNIITTRIDDAVGAGTIPNSINLGDDLKVQSNNRVLISPVSLTGAAVAQLEVRGQAGVTTNSVFKTKTAGNTSSQIAIECENLAGNSLFYVDATAKMFWNTSKQATGDIRMDGGTNSNAWYFDAGEEAIVMGGTNPVNSAIQEWRSTTKAFLKPVMTEAQRDAIGSLTFGLEINNNTTNTQDHYNGTSWVTTTTNETVGIEGFFLDPIGAFGTGGGWADDGLIEDFPSLLFSPTLDERAIYMFYGLTRAKFDAVDPQVGFVIYSTGAPVVTTGDSVVWELEARYVADGESLAGAADETIQVTEGLATIAANTRQTNVFFTLDRALISDQDIIHLTLTRIGTDGSDIYASDVGVGQAGFLVQTLNHNP